MQTLTRSVTIGRHNIQPQLDILFGPDGLPADQFAHVQGLAGELRDNGNGVFLRGVPEGPLTGFPILLDDEKLERFIDQVPRQQGPRSTIIAAGNVSQDESDQRRRALSIAGLRKLGRLCASVDMPFSFYDTAYPGGTPIGRVKADMLNAGALEYLLRMRELGRPPKDRPVLSSDVDIWTMDSSYMADMQTGFDESDTPAWMGSPAVSHELLDGRFPRINHLLRWYDERLNQFRTPTHFGVNLAAYAAVGGLDTSRSLGESNALYRELVGRFGEENIAESYLDNPVIVSSRHLVERIINGGGLEYEGLQVPAAGAGDSYRSTIPNQDITSGRMRKLLSVLVMQRYITGESAYLKLLNNSTMSPYEARHQASIYAASRILRMHEAVGQFENSEDVVHQALLVAVRYSIKASKP